MEELLKQCRYYKGERECPQEINTRGLTMFWGYEKKWCEDDYCRNEENSEMREYLFYGLKDFSADDGVAISIKAILFNRYCHWQSGPSLVSESEGFKTWYHEIYPHHASREYIEYSK